MKTITTSAAHSLTVGEFFTIDIPVHDQRRWPRFKAWLLRRPPPVVTMRQMFRVTEVVSGTAFDAQEDTCPGS